MSPFRSVCAALALMLLLGSAPCAQGQSQSPQDLLTKALAMVDIRAEGSPAFHMRASVHFYEGMSSTEGSYDLKWQSPTSWREEVEVGSLRQIRIADTDKLWEERNLPYFTPAVEDIEKVMEFPRHVQLLGNERAKAVQEREVNGIRVDCFEVKEGRDEVKKVCLQKDSDFPTRVDYARQNGGGGFQYENPIPFGVHRYPRVIKSFDKNRRLEFRVEELTALHAEDSASFRVPPGARSYRWCPNPTQAEPLGEPVPISPDVAAKVHGERAVIYGVVGTDGQWHDLAVVESSGKVSESIWFSFVREVHYRPAYCGGTAVETERLTKFRGQ